MKRICLEAGVILAFLPPYSPDFNPIEEQFSVIKSWMKRHGELAEFYPDFKDFLDIAVIQNSTPAHARKHFQNAGIGIEEWERNDI